MNKLPASFTLLSVSIQPKFHWHSKWGKISFPRLTSPRRKVSNSDWSCHRSAHCRSIIIFKTSFIFLPNLRLSNQRSSFIRSLRPGQKLMPIRRRYAADAILRLRSHVEASLRTSFPYRIPRKRLTHHYRRTIRLQCHKNNSLGLPVLAKRIRRHDFAHWFQQRRSSKILLPG